MNRLVVVVALGLSLPALAGPYDAAKGRATKAISAATKRIDAVGSCANTQGANIRDAMRQVKALNTRTPAETYDSVNLFLAGLALGGALSGCPDDLYPHITKAQNAITEMRNAAYAAAPAAASYEDDEDEDDGVQAQVGNASSSRGVEADDVIVNPNFVDQRGEQAILFQALGVESSNLQGKKISWNLLVKRKSQGWNKAKSYSIGETRIQQASQAIGNVGISVRYSTFAREGYAPGEYVAALVGSTDKGKVSVFRDEMPFSMPVLNGAAPAPSYASNTYVERDVPADEPAGPTAMSGKAFKGFLTALQGANTDFSKVDMVKNAAKKNYFTADQLGRMIDTMNTDFSKLDAAKAVVPKLVDSENAYGIADKFNTGFSKQEYTALLSG